ncbi:MAG TPA: S9 family peptidase [Gaiellales bacterium]|nr:S9 family peptidase [Gaiellales bacterium]
MIAERLLDLLHPSQPAFSPDGTRVAFSVGESFSRPDEGVSSRIWTAAADGSGARQATDGPRSDTTPRWSPDGRTLAFLADRDSAGRAAVHLLDDGAGEARPVGTLEGSAEDMRFSPDGSRLLVLAADPGSDRAGADSATRIDAGDGDPKVTRPAEHWRRLYTVDIATGETTRIGPDGMNVWEFDWRGGDVAAVVSEDPSESGWYRARLAVIDLATGAARTLHTPAMQIAYPTLSPDGGTIAFVEGFCSDRGILLGETTVVAKAGGDARVLAPRIDVGCLAWRDERTLWFAGARGLAHAVGTIGLDGGADVLWSGDESLLSGWVPVASPSPDGTTLAAAHSSWESVPELRALTVADPDAGWRALSQLNPEPVAVAGACARRTWTSDGLEIEGLLLTPTGTAPFPLIVWVHGGPTDSYDCSHPDARLAGMLEAGYAILLPNPRGSSGRGQDFARANLGDMGGGDLRDILAGVEAVVAEGAADGDRVAIVGTSYGGFMSAWAISQTDRFRASVPMAAVTNWPSFHNTTNIGRFDELFLDADPYDPTGDYFNRSPVAHVRRVKTPTLVMHGELDLCVPLSQGQELYQALAAEGVETELVVYAREGHGWRERGHVLDGIERMRAWLDRHLAV